MSDALEVLRAKVEAADVTRWSIDYLPIDDPDSSQLEGWRIHDMPDEPNPQGVWIANYICGGLEKEDAELIVAAVNLAKRLCTDEGVEALTQAICKAGEIHLTCDYPNCGCARTPAQARAAIRAIIGELS